MKGFYRISTDWDLSVYPITEVVPRENENYSINNISSAHIRSLLDGHYYSAIQFPITFVMNGFSDEMAFYDIAVCRGEPILISSALKAILERHQITGWKTFPMRLLEGRLFAGVHGGDPNNEIPGYHGFSITGRCGARDRSQCRIVKQKLSQVGKVRDYPKDGWPSFWQGRAEGNKLVDIAQGIYLNPAAWDGSDICIEDKYWDIILSPKAAKAFKIVENVVELTPLEACYVAVEDYKRLDALWEKAGRPKTYSGN